LTSYFVFFLCVLFLLSPLSYLVSVIYLKINTTLNNIVCLDPVFENTVSSIDINSKNPLTDEQFYEWLRGLVDGEGSFSIVPSKNNFYFKFAIYMHKDDTPMLKAVALRLKVGYVNIGDHFASYSVTSKEDLVKLFSIFDRFPLNTSKNLNYLMLKKGYQLYFNRKTSGEVSSDITQEILALKDQMNTKRNSFKQPESHRVIITPYWLLGFVEAEGYFSVATKSHRLEFGIGQTATELNVLEAIQEFILNLPGSYKITRSDTNAVSLNLDNKAKNANSKPMAKIQVYKTDFITNILVPFFDNLNWLSKKELDYIDWKWILAIKNQGKHFTDEGKELISLISKRTNRNRLSTNLAKPSVIDLQVRVSNLLASPSNYDIHPDGKIWIKSSGVYLKGRGNVAIKVLDDKGILIYSFDSIKQCAIFFGVSDRTINRRLSEASFVQIKGQNLIFKRYVTLP